MSAALGHQPARTVPFPEAGVECRPWLATSLIMLADALALASIFLFAVLVRHAAGGRYELSLYWRLWPVLGLFLAAFALFGQYPGIVFNAVTESRRLASATTVVFLVLAVLTFILRVADVYSRLVFFMGWAMAAILIPVARMLVRRYFARCEWWGYPTLVFAGGEPGRRVLQKLHAQPELGFRIKAVMDADSGRAGVPYGVPVVRHFEGAVAIARHAGISHAIIAMPAVACTKLLEMLESDAGVFPHVFLMPNLGELSSLGVEVRDVCQQLTLEVRRSLLMPTAQILKRAIDVSLAILIGILLLPVFLAIILVLKLESRGPAFYRQIRIGLRGETFWIWKLRSMSPNADRILEDYLEAHPESLREWQQDHKLKRDPRVTRVGRILRKTSLDELPQIWNVIRGEMSLVGPRPIVYDEVAKYGEGFQLYMQVLPGITGLWQVSGRNDTSYADRMELDSYYVRNWSPWFDLYLLGRTVKTVLAREGAY